MADLELEILSGKAADETKATALHHASQPHNMTDPTSKNGNQIQFTAPPVQTAPAAVGGDSMSHYEQLIATASRIVIRNAGGSRKPTVETIALDVFHGPGSSSWGEFYTPSWVRSHPQSGPVPIRLGLGLG